MAMNLTLRIRNGYKYWDNVCTHAKFELFGCDSQDLYPRYAHGSRGCDSTESKNIPALMQYFSQHYKWGILFEEGCKPVIFGSAPQWAYRYDSYRDFYANCIYPYLR